MSKADQLRKKYGERIRESLGSGVAEVAEVVEHPAQNRRFEGTTRATGYRNIRLQDITADPQHRETFNEDELTQLAQSLSADGLIAPIVVRWDAGRTKYVIIAGERRFRAAKLCGWDTITCDVKPDGISEGEIAELQLAENHARKDLNPIELATAFRDVIKKNAYTARELAKRVGVNETTVTRYVRLLSLPADIQEKLIEAKIPVAIAREAARLDGADKQRAFIERAIREGFSATDAQRAASGRRKKGRRKKTPGSQVFATDYGDVRVELKDVMAPNYEHVAAMLEEALGEVRHRINNGIRLR